MPKKKDIDTYWRIIERQRDILNKKQQLKLKDSQITILGCGGIGGAAAEMLARMGAGKLRIIDKDVFDTSNINRQLMSDLGNIGKNKTEITAKKIRSVNPIVEIDVYNEELVEDNVYDILRNSKVVVDALDNLISRIIVSRCASELNIPFIHGAIHGTKGQVTTFTSETPNYEVLFKLPSEGMDLNDDIILKINQLDRKTPPVIGPVPNIVGCIEAFEVVKILTGKGKPILAPKVLIFDLIKEEAFSIINL